MAKKVAITNLNARSIDIVNVIRQNASYEYQQLIPTITSEKDLPAVGEALYGYPAMANQFINALVNRIALVRVKSATFNNPFVDLKKGYLENGETVEEVFTEIAKAREFNVEKAEQREFKRTVPDVRSAFHTMNWRVQYPVTIQNEDLRMAFLSAEGVTDLIAKIVDTVYRAAEYDEYLLFKYLMIKAIAHGKMYPVSVNMSDIKNAAVAFRGMSNKLTFIKPDYNIAGVHVNTDKADQYIFMDSEFNAQFDVNVLASAFNMDKADFMGRLHLVDDWSSFDNDRFAEITDSTDMIEPVTAEELAITAGVKAVLVDREWFQFYDNLAVFTEKYVSSGLYWNYFYNVWKTVSSSPFSNAVVFMDSNSMITVPNTFKAKVDAVTTGGTGTIVTLGLPDNAWLEQTEDAVEDGVAVHKYGSVILPVTSAEYVPVANIGNVIYNGGSRITATAAVGDEITFTKQV